MRAERAGAAGRAARRAARRPPLAVQAGARRAPAQHVNWADGPAWRLVILMEAADPRWWLVVLAGRW